MDSRQPIKNSDFLHSLKQDIHLVEDETSFLQFLARYETILNTMNTVLSSPITGEYFLDCEEGTEFVVLPSSGETFTREEAKSYQLDPFTKQAFSQLDLVKNLFVASRLDQVKKEIAALNDEVKEAKKQVEARPIQELKEVTKHIAREKSTQLKCILSMQMFKQRSEGMDDLIKTGEALVKKQEEAQKDALTEIADQKAALSKKIHELESRKRRLESKGKEEAIVKSAAAPIEPAPLKPIPACVQEKPLSTKVYSVAVSSAGSIGMALQTSAAVTATLWSAYYCSGHYENLPINPFGLIANDYYLVPYFVLAALSKNVFDTKTAAFLLFGCVALQGMLTGTGIDFGMGIALGLALNWLNEHAFQLYLCNSSVFAFAAIYGAMSCSKDVFGPSFNCEANLVGSNYIFAMLAGIFHSLRSTTQLSNSHYSLFSQQSQKGKQEAEVKENLVASSQQERGSIVALASKHSSRSID